MVTINPVVPDLAFAMRDVRLAALKDTPLAFGSTYERESKFTDAEWMHRASSWNGEQRVAYLAWDGDQACGIAAGHLDEHDASKAHLFSMWVAPTHRTIGVGRSLVQQVISWAKSRGAGELILSVTSCNHGAEQFYVRLGFARTGRTEPYPNRADLIEYEMSRSLVIPG
jgi:GNAT superfamily N-acetyltransferase